jgi:hypothetical protein
MKKTLGIIVIAAFMTSCGLPAPKEQTIPLLNLSITVPSKNEIKAEAAGQYNMANADFIIDKNRFEIREIDEKKMPTDVKMLAEAIKADDDFVALTEEKTLSNGAFGIVYDNKKGKDLLFYFKKEARCYKVTPAFNKEGKYYNEAIEAIGTLK